MAPSPPSHSTQNLPASPSDSDFEEALLAFYPEAYSDTSGTCSKAPFLYKTGPRWPANDPKYFTKFYRRMKAIPRPPASFADAWPDISWGIARYVEGEGIKVEAVMGVGWGVSDEFVDADGVCPLLVLICLDPVTIGLPHSKVIAETAKREFLEKRGFSDIEVAVWAVNSRINGLHSPLLPALSQNIEFHDNLQQSGYSRSASLHHIFRTSLGLAISPETAEQHQGTGGLFLKRAKEGKEDYFLLTAAHVVRPPPEYHLEENIRATEEIAAQQREGCVLLGGKSYSKALEAINVALQRFKDVLDLYGMKRDTCMSHGDQGRKEQVDAAISNLTTERENLLELKTHAESISKFPARLLGYTAYAEKIGPSSKDSDAFTVDWAVIRLNDDLCDWSSLQNRFFLAYSSKLDFVWSLFFSNTQTDSHEWQELVDLDITLGHLKVSGSVPKEEFTRMPHVIGSNERTLLVLTNGSKSGTRLGAVNGLDAVIRVYSGYKPQQIGGPTETLDFLARSPHVVPLACPRYATKELMEGINDLTSARGFESEVNGPGQKGFSQKGDSGAMVVDRSGRLVGLLTGGSGVGETEDDTTWVTPWYLLEPLIREALGDFEVL